MSNSSTTTETDRIEPIHHGEILMEDFIGIDGRAVVIACADVSRSCETGTSFVLKTATISTCCGSRGALHDTIAEMTSLQVP